MNWNSIWNETFVEFPGIECNKQCARAALVQGGPHECLTSFYIIGTNWERDVTSEMKKQKKIHTHTLTQRSLRFPHSHRHHLLRRKCSPWPNKKQHKCAFFLSVSRNVCFKTDKHSHTPLESGKRCRSNSFVDFSVVFHFSFEIFLNFVLLSNYIHQAKYGIENCVVRH